MHLWCRLLEQTEMILNMLQASRIHPSLSAYNELHGVFGFSKTPLVPLKIKTFCINILHIVNCGHCMRWMKDI